MPNSGSARGRAPQNINTNVYDPPIVHDPFELAPNGVEERLDPQWPVSGDVSRTMWPPVSFSRTLDTVSKLMGRSGRQISNVESTNVEDRRGEQRPNTDLISKLLERIDLSKIRMPPADPSMNIWPNLMPSETLNAHSRPNVPGRRGDQIEAILDHMSRP